MQRPALSALAAPMIFACVSAYEPAFACEASWYGGRHHGRLTASGERFNQNALTAAHRTMKFGTHVRVTCGSRSVTVRITDRGPASWTGRCIDVSRGAAERLGFVSRGTCNVSLGR